MGQTQDEMTEHWEERWCWEVAWRDAARVARRLYRKPRVDGVSQREEGARLDDFFRFLPSIGVMVLWEEAHGAAIPRAMVPFVPDCPARGGEEPVGD